jgi:tetratricopeptide (TPR) repeat protein
VAAATAVVRAASAQLSEAAASALFQEGLALFDAGNPKGAAEKWERLLAEGDPARAWRVLYNLGLAYEAAGDRPRSIERLEAFVRRVGLEPGTLPAELEDRRQDAVDRANKLRPTLGVLRVAKSETGESIVVRIDGGAPRPAGFETYVEPGKHVVVMGEVGRQVTVEVGVAAGERKDLVASQRPPPEPPPPPPPPKKEPLVHPAIVIGGGVLTALSVALPVSLYFRAKGLRDDAEAIGRVDPDYPEAVEVYEAWRTGYFASWAAPAALGAVTLSLLVATVVDGSTAASVSVSASGASLRVRLE